MKTIGLTATLAAIFVAAIAYADDGSSIDQSKMDAAYANLRQRQSATSQPGNPQPLTLQQRIDDLADQLQRLAAQNQQAMADDQARARQFEAIKAQLNELRQEANVNDAKPAAFGAGVHAPADAAPEKTPATAPAPHVETHAAMSEIRGVVHPGAIAADASGITVRLLRANVPRGAVVQCLDANMKHLDQLADHEDKLIDEIKDSLPDYARDHAMKARQFRELSNKAHAAILQLDDHDLSALAAFDLVKETSYPVPNFFAAVTAATIAQTKTEADGHYSFGAVPDGVYYVYANFDTQSTYIEWLIPVRMKDGGADQDLTLTNASVNKGQ